MYYPIYVGLMELNCFLRQDIVYILEQFPRQALFQGYIVVTKNV